MNTRGRPLPPRRLWWLTAGFAVWCNALAVLYALQAIGCVFAWPASALRWTLVVVFLAHLIVVGWMWRGTSSLFAQMQAVSSNGGPNVTAFGDTGNFLQAVVEWTIIAAFFATALTFGPPLLLTACI